MENLSRSSAAEMQDLNLNYASREALFDPESEMDMLDDYDLLASVDPPMSPLVNQQENPPIDNDTANIVLIGVHVNNVDEIDPVGTCFEIITLKYIH